MELRADGGTRGTDADVDATGATGAGAAGAGGSGSGATGAGATGAGGSGSGGSPPEQKSVIKWIGSGKYSDVFLVSNGRKHMAMKISYYRDDTVCKFVNRIKAGDLTGALRAKQTDAIAVGSEFSKFTRGIMDTVTPHFVLVFCDVDCKSFAERLPLLTKTRLDDLTPFQRRYNNVCFMEVYSCDMTKYLSRSTYDERTLRTLIFQVLYTIAAMQKLLPGWRHNDLSTNNVLVKKLRKHVAASYTIRLSNAASPTTFYTDTPIFIAINDYDFVHVPDHPRLENQRVMGGNYKVDGRDNKSYDACFFLKSVLRCIAKKPRKDFAKTVEFLKGIGLRDEDRQNEEIPSLKPLTLLANPYFAPLKKKISVSSAFEIPPT